MGCFDKSKRKKRIIAVLLIIVIVFFPFIFFIMSFIKDSFPYARSTEYLIYTIDHSQKRPGIVNLGNKTHISEHFYASSTGVVGFSIRYISGGNNKGIIHIFLYCDGDLIDKIDQDISKIKGDEVVLYDCFVNTFEGTDAEKEYQIEIVGTDELNSLYIPLSEKKGNDILIINDEEMNNSIQFSVTGASGKISLRYTLILLQLDLVITILCFISYLSKGNIND